MAKFGEDSAASCAALNITATATAELCDETFGALVRRQSRFVLCVAFSVLRNGQDAEDVVQETFDSLLSETDPHPVIRQDKWQSNVYYSAQKADRCLFLR